MARLYKVTADTSEKEKIIGGVLTFMEGAWVALGMIVGAGLFLMLTGIGIPAFPALLLGVPPGLLLGGIFGFYKVEGLPYLTYLVLKKEFAKKSKLMINTCASNYEKGDQPIWK